MENQFLKTMSGLQDEKLIEILKTKEEYLPEAIEAAELEFRKRNIPAEKLTEIEEQVTGRLERQNIRRTENEDKPLEFLWKFLLVASPLSMIVLNLFFIGKYRAEGYTRKEKETKEYFIIGILVYIGLFLFIQLINWLP